MSLFRANHSNHSGVTPPSPGEVGRPAKKPNEKGYKLESQRMTSRYDHAAMFADRLTGMSWEDIAAKHNVASGAVSARLILMNSRFMARITPAQVAAFEAVGRAKVPK